MTLARAGIHGKSRMVAPQRALSETSEVWSVELIAQVETLLSIGTQTNAETRRLIGLCRAIGLHLRWSASCHPLLEARFSQWGRRQTRKHAD